MGWRETSPVCTWHFFVANKLSSWGFSPALASVRSRLLELILAGNSRYTSAVQVSARWSRNGAEREERGKGNRNISSLWETGYSTCMPLRKPLYPCCPVLVQSPERRQVPGDPLAKKKKKNRNRIPQALLYFLCFTQDSHQKGVLL